MKLLGWRCTTTDLIKGFIIFGLFSFSVFAGAWIIKLLPNFISSHYITFYDIFFQFSMLGLEWTLSFHAILFLLFQFVELFLRFFVSNHEICYYFMRLPEVVVSLCFYEQPINLLLLFLGSIDNLLTDVLLLEVGWLEFLYFYFGVVILFGF